MVPPTRGSDSALLPCFTIAMPQALIAPVQYVSLGLAVMSLWPGGGKPCRFDSPLSLESESMTQSALPAISDFVASKRNLPACARAETVATIAAAARTRRLTKRRRRRAVAAG